MTWQTAAIISLIIWNLRQQAQIHQIKHDLGPILRRRR